MRGAGGGGAEWLGDVVRCGAVYDVCVECL